MAVGTLGKPVWSRHTGSSPTNAELSFRFPPGGVPSRSQWSEDQFGTAALPYLSSHNPLFCSCSTPAHNGMGSPWAAVSSQVSFGGQGKSPWPLVYRSICPTHFPSRNSVQRASLRIHLSTSSSPSSFFPPPYLAPINLEPKSSLSPQYMSLILGVSLLLAFRKTLYLLGWWEIKAF